MTLRPRSALLTSLLCFAAATWVHGPGSASAGETWCVGAKGECDTRSVRKLHGDWHFHTHVTDGTHCFECYDEVDDTCDSGFLGATPGWRAIQPGTCRLVGAAPRSEGVKFHRIDGEDVVAPPPPLEQVQLTAEVSAAPGPHALGDTVQMSVRVLDPDGATRSFGGGEIVLHDSAGREVARVPVSGGADGTGHAEVTLDQGGDVTARFEVADPTLRKGETLRGTAAKDLALQVGECPFRGEVEPGEGVLLQGETVAFSGVVRSHLGNLVDPSELPLGDLEFVLSLADGQEIRTPARAESGRLVAEVTLPPMTEDLVDGQVSLTAQGARPVCPGVVRSLQVSKLPVAIRPTAPPRCWTDLPCEVEFEILVPGGAAAAAAERFLQAPDFELSARAGGAPANVDGSIRARRLRLTYTPEREGTATYHLSLGTADQDIEAIVQVPVAESIRLSLPKQLDLGVLSGGATVEDTCQTLDFSASGGAIAAQFTVELESTCAECGLELVSAVTGQAEHLPLTIMVGLDQQLPICAVLGRCPTGGDGGTQTLVVRPTAAPFVDQTARVEVRYEVTGRSALSCWGWLLKILAGFALLAAWLYGFVRPYSFEEGAVVRISGAEKTLKRAMRQALGEMKGGRKRWYRSAKVHLDGGGSPVSSASRAILTLAATSAGTVIRSRAPILRQDPRTRRMVSVDADELAGGLVAQRGRIYQVGSVWLKVGS